MAEIPGRRSPDVLYCEAAETFGPALTRLVSAYESNPDRRRDLLQDIHLALWRSFARFDGRCSLRTLERLLALVRSLKPPDRQVIVLYLEGESASAIADITGLTAGNVATRIHRIRQVLISRFQKGELHDR